MSKKKKRKREEEEDYKMGLLAIYGITIGLFILGISIYGLVVSVSNLIGR